MGGLNKILLLVLVFSILFSFSVSAESEPESFGDRVIECPDDFINYKEEYNINENDFNELFESCYTISNQDILNKEVKEGKVILNKTRKYKGSQPKPKNYKPKQRELPSNMKALSKENILTHLKENKDSIKWIKSANKWGNEINKTSIYKKNTVKSYIHLFKKSLFARLKSMGIF